MRKRKKTKDVVSFSRCRCQTPASVLPDSPHLHLAFSASLLGAKSLATPPTAVSHSWLHWTASSQKSQPGLGLLYHQSDPVSGTHAVSPGSRSPACPGSPACLPPPPRASTHRALAVQTPTVARNPSAHTPVWPAGAPVCLRGRSWRILYRKGSDGIDRNKTKTFLRLGD